MFLLTTIINYLELVRIGLSSVSVSQLEYQHLVVYLMDRCNTLRESMIPEVAFHLKYPPDGAGASRFIQGALVAIAEIHGVYQGFIQHVRRVLVFLYMPFFPRTITVNFSSNLC